jgi:hypothetical protein
VELWDVGLQLSARRGLWGCECAAVRKTNDL